MNWEQKYDALASMIEGYRHERNEAQARVIDAALIHAELVRERDEARADLARSVAAWESAGMRGRTAHDAMLALAKERDEARAEVQEHREQLRKLPDANRVSTQAAYRRGAEAMREACQQWCRAWENNGEAIADALADLSIPEEP